MMEASTMIERLPLGDQIRRAIRESGRTIYDLAVASGCDQANIRAFMAGRRGLSLVALEKLVLELGLELKPSRDPNKLQPEPGETDTSD